MWRSRLTTIALGVLGMFLGLLLWHAYSDHIAFHQLADYLNQQAPKINRLP